ncbi:MAG: hypothetical protein M3Q55_14330 [Acidobacteriota bacterium]|nr:hypothetical protein [Acidobacteriota bacterium]
MTQTPRHLTVPHPRALMVGCIVLAGVLTHVIPSGAYERRADGVTGPRDGRGRHVPTAR